jgi:hypothetical protein
MRASALTAWFSRRSTAVAVCCQNIDPTACATRIGQRVFDLRISQAKFKQIKNDSVFVVWRSTNKAVTSTFVPDHGVVRHYKRTLLVGI